jgi:outer membrane protein assembly factor BamB
MALQDLVTRELRGLGVFNSVGLDPGSQVVTLGTDRIYHAGVGPTGPCDPLPSLGLRAYPTGESVSGCGIITSTPEWQVVPGPDGVPVLSPDGTTVYVGRGQIGAFDAQTGAELWRTSIQGSLNDPALAGGLLFVASGPYQTTPETLYAFASAGCGAATCAPVWSATLAAVPGGADEAILQPAVAGGVVFIAGSGGMLNAFDAAGCGAAVCTPIWTAAVGSEITGAPAVSDGQLYVGTADGRLVAFGLSDG